MTSKDRGPQESTTHRKHPFREALDRATRWFGNLLAPLVIITYVKDLGEAIDYLRQRPLLTGSFVLIFILVLLYNVLRTINIQFRTRVWWRAWLARKGAPEPEEAIPSEDSPEQEAVKRLPWPTMLRWTAILGSFVAMGLLVYVYVLIFVTGIHFVAVASAPDKASAIREIQSLNRFFKAQGYSNLEARTYASTATGTGWYMISIGGPHTSRKAAEATFKEARQALGPRMRQDAYIYSTENASPLRVIRNWVRGILRRLIGW